MEYTKGEWKFKRNSFNIDEVRELSIGAVMGGRYNLALAQIYSDGGIGEDTAEANAHLISAAPNCYEGLKDALVEICRLCVRLNPQHENCTSCEDMEQRRWTLAKAEGKNTT